MSDKTYDLKRPICGSCLDCLRITNLLSRPRKKDTGVAVPGTTKPTAKALKKHGEKFGWNGVAEVGSAYGIDIKVPKGAEMVKEKKKRKVSTKEIKQRIRTYLEEERSLDYIAEIESISPSRARKLVRELEEEEVK